MESVYSPQPINPPATNSPNTSSEVSLCSSCHQPVTQNAYFCANCGFNLKPAPPKTSLGSQFELYLKSLLLPPFGIIWGYKYLKQKDTKSRLIGLTAIIITVIILIITVKITVNLINTVNDQVNSQMENLF